MRGSAACGRWGWRLARPARGPPKAKEGGAAGPAGAGVEQVQHPRRVARNVVHEARAGRREECCGHRGHWAVA